MHGRNEAALQTLANEIHSRYGSVCHIYVANVEQFEAMQNIANDFVKRAGASYILIANASIINTVTTAETPEEMDKFKQIFDVNVLGIGRATRPSVCLGGYCRANTWTRQHHQ